MKKNFNKVIVEYNEEKKKNPKSNTIFILKNRKTGIYYLSLFWSRTFIETLKAPEEKVNYYEIYL
tara:strand:+ start:916 stop:1110 length:195 start_codon:yes stop_codon:yes gene_type:complete